MWTHILYVGGIFTWGDSILFCRKHVHLDVATTISKTFTQMCGCALEVHWVNKLLAAFLFTGVLGVIYDPFELTVMNKRVGVLGSLWFATPTFSSHGDWKIIWNHRIFKNNCYTLVWTPSGWTSEKPRSLYNKKFQQGGDKYSTINSPPFFLLSSYTCRLFHVQSR